MRNLTGLAAAAAFLAMPLAGASAATVQLDSNIFNGTDFTYSYGGTLAPTEGVTTGSMLVILDFAGYVDGSIFSPYANIVATAESTTSGIVLGAGVADDPTLYNLVFTYVGLDYHVTPPPVGSSYLPIDFTGLSARSTIGAVGTGSFATVSIKNEGDAAGTAVFSLGSAGVPAVPEPASWGLMIVGCGAIGFTMRKRNIRNLSLA